MRFYAEWGLQSHCLLCGLINHFVGIGLFHDVHHWISLACILVNVPRVVTMHPLRALWEWYNNVHWTSLIKNQDVNTRFLGSHPPFGWFKNGRHKKRQNAYKV